MRRLWIFLTLFGLGLLGLVVWLGPRRVVREADKTIATSDLGAARAPVQVADPLHPGGAIGFEMRGAGKIPVWDDVVGPDGSKRRVKTALLEYQDVQPFTGGFHFDRPAVTLFSSTATSERATRRVAAGSADVAMRGDLAQLSQSSEGLREQDVRAFTLAGDVVLLELDEQGRTTLELTTARLEAPELPREQAAQRPVASRLVAPGPTHLVATPSADANAKTSPVGIVSSRGFDLTCGGLELDRVADLLTLQPPIVLTSEAPDQERLELTAAGPATFVRSAPAGSASRTTAPPASGDVGAIVGPGELTFTRDVVVKLGAAGKPSTLRVDRLVAVLARDAQQRLVVDRLDAGSEPSNVAFEVLGGTGRAHALHYTRAESELAGALVLDGPVELHDLVVGEGEKARKLTLTAKRRLVAHDLPADASRSLPARQRVELEEDAHATIPDELEADAQRLVADVVPLASGGSRVLQLELLGESGRNGAPAVATLPNRGVARAARIVVTDDGSGGHVAHLESAADESDPKRLARAETERGFVCGPTIDVTAPADPKVPARIVVPRLVNGEIALPEDAALDTGLGATASHAAQRRLVLEPLRAVAFTGSGDEVRVAGRCRCHVRPVGADDDLQTLDADELNVIPAPAARRGARVFDLRAVGDVDLEDGENGAHATANFAYTERAPDGTRQLVLLGAPATVAFALRTKEASTTTGERVTTRASKVVLDLERGTVQADDPSAQVVVVLPEALIGELFPTLGATKRTSDVVAPPKPDAAPLEFRADHVTITPAQLANRRDAFAAARVAAKGRVSATRPSDGSHVVARELALDLARRSARLDGDDDAPVVVTRPKPYDRSRVESIEAKWIDVKQNGRRVELAPRAVFTLHPEGDPTAARPLPAYKRVELHAADAPLLDGKVLTFTGGVESLLVDGDVGDPRRRTVKTASDRCELILDRPLDEGNVALLQFNATQHVSFVLNSRQMHDCRGESALLSYDFVNRWLEVKQGVDPCSFLGRDRDGRWMATSHFHRLLQHLSSDDNPSEESRLEGLDLLVEGKLER